MTVSKQEANTNEIVVDVIPLSFSQFAAMGMNIPLELDARTLPDPAERES